MEKKVFYALACVLCLTGCSSQSAIEEVILPEVKQSPIQFSVQMEKETLSFPVTRSMPENTIGEPSAFSKATEGDAELNELCSTLEYVVFKEEESEVTLVKHRQYVYNAASLDVDFGIVYDTLPAGNYTFYFFAHNSKSATLSGTTFSFDSITDSFFEVLPLEIQVAETINENITLNRIVSRIEFMATDPVTEELKQFDMEIENLSNQIDLANGYGLLATEKQTFSYQFQESEIGETEHIHAFYTFVSDTDTPMTARLAAISQNDEEIRVRQIKEIVPEANKIIRYKGRLYSRSEADNTFQISIYNNGEWEETAEVVLPEYE